jgi:dynein heavy chain
MFTNYEIDLLNTRNTYEEFKSNPPLLRNAPPVAGAIVWVRQLLKNIEEPMKHFNQNKYISNLEGKSATNGVC